MQRKRTLMNGKQPLETGLNKKIKRGEMYLINLNPNIGAEIGKIRPAVVISNDVNNTYADTITVIPITSSVDKVYPFEVLLEKGAGGLDKDSKAKCNQIRSIDKKRLHKYIGTLKEDKIKELEEAILIHLDIRP